MILHIRNSRIGKIGSVFMIFIFLGTLNPLGSYALTGGPAQPEFNSFTPIGTSDMVDLASGDFSYNIPLMDVGGFPINLAYNSGVTMDQEASWVGLGWDLSIGQINRQMRGLPDDFDGDQMTYQNDMKDDFTVGVNFKVTPNLAGVEATPGPVSVGATMQYNNYTGMSLSPSIGISYAVTNNIGLGLDVSSSPDGMSLSPSVSLSAKKETKNKSETKLGLNLGTTFNSRQGLSNVNMSASYNGFFKWTKDKESRGFKTNQMSTGSSISFMPNYHTPTIQDNMMVDSYTFNLALGGLELFTVEGNWQFRAFFSNQYIPDYLNTSTRNAYGYDNTHLAGDSELKDFNREKDGGFTKNSTNLPITNYTYDIYSVKGQGVSGMFRPYRSQVGYVNDASSSKFSNGVSLGVEQGQGNSVKVGMDIETTETESHGGIWSEETGNDALPELVSDAPATDFYEEVYYKNVGDLGSDPYLQGSPFHKYGPMRLELAGDKYDRSLSTDYDYKDGTDASVTSPLIKRSQRTKRNQTILKVKNSDITTEEGTLLGFESNPHAKSHHTAGFIVTRNDGARYIYGEALYNTAKKEISFAIDNDGDASTGRVPYTPGEDNDVANNKNNDKYFNSVETPAYAHTYLLTTLLSTDYSDVDGIAGPSENDYGSYTKFTYNDAINDYKWRVPFTQNEANYNEGLKTSQEDDRASYVYGEKEMKYIQKIETKTHVGIFYISPRDDGFGVSGENGGLGSTSQMYKLDRIALYSKGEYEETGVDVNGNILVSSESTPIKEVHFEYGYDLCQDIPNNNGLNYDHDNDPGTPSLVNEGGKLTLKKVYFTYRGSNMGKYSPYIFSYDQESSQRNPDYNLKAYDIWGCYKPNSDSPTARPTDPITVPEFNYVEQDEAFLSKELLDDYTSAWSMRKIELPSGGEINVEYESDEYRYVQDKEAMRMFKVVGAGRYLDPVAEDVFNPGDIASAKLDRVDGIGGEEARYLYIRLPEDETLGDELAEEETEAEEEERQEEAFYGKYIREIIESYDGLIQFRFLLNMSRKGGKNSTSDFSSANFDYVDGYFKLQSVVPNGYKIFSEDGEPDIRYASIPMKFVEKESAFGMDGPDVNPISKAGWQFARKYLSKEVYEMGEVDENGDPGVIVKTVFQSLQNLKEVFKGPNGVMRDKKISRRFVPEKSWIRLMNPNKRKKGGGCRVKKITMTDDWANMTSSEDSNNGAGINDAIPAEERDQKYGQEYIYDTEDEAGNVFSSGVATFEPVGAKDNPLVQPEFVNINRVLGPDDGNYFESPFGESFFPSPTVTYSKVTVSNLTRLDVPNNRSVRKHATGKVVTEFYTSKDYPTLCDQTDLDIIEDGGEPGEQLLQNLLKVNVRKHLTLTQGYSIHVNDMNGKMKRQLVYAENQTSPMSGVTHLYEGFELSETGDFTTDLSSTGGGNINNQVDILDANGHLSNTKLGVEVDVINDFREMTTETTVTGVNVNTATFIASLPIIIPIPLPDYAHHEEKLDMSVTTKVINTFGIQRETIAYDAGASVSTKNLLWDAETGEVLLTETVNEYDDKYYSLNYPAHWFYKGMAAAYFNSGVEKSLTPSGTGTYSVPGAGAYFHAGDEVLLTDDNGRRMLWVNEVEGSSIDLIKADGNPYEGAGETAVKIIRSGRRNLQSTSMASVVLQQNPLDLIADLGGTLDLSFLMTDDYESSVENKVINAGAVIFSDEWAEECILDEQGREIDIDNAYRNNSKGVWRAVKSYLFLAMRHHNKGVLGADDAATPEGKDRVDPRNDGFYTTFSPFYQYDKDVSGDWVIDETDWTYTSEVTRFSPFGFETENKDALNRYSAAQYGYNNSFPLAVGANASSNEIGFDGFEDYDFGSSDNAHFNFKGLGGVTTEEKSHTGRTSLKILPGQRASKVYRIECPEE